MLWTGGRAERRARSREFAPDKPLCLVPEAEWGLVSENGQTLLHMRADFSHVLVGNYDLVVEAKGFRVTVPVVVKITSSGRIQ